MSLHIVDDQCVLNDTNGKVVIRSSSANGAVAFPELSGAEARRMALMKAAQHGLASPGISGNPDIYPVDVSGNEVVDVKTQKIDHFRVDIPVTRQLV